MRELKTAIESEHLEFFNKQEVYDRKKPQAIENIDWALHLQDKHRKPSEENQKIIDWANGCPFSIPQQEYVATLENGSVGSEGSIFNDSSLYALNSVYPRNVNYSATQIKFTELVTIIQKWGYGYGHWLPESLSRLLQFIDDTNKNDIKVLTWDNSFIRQFLNLVGIKDEQIVPFNNGNIYTAEKLYVPTPVYCGNPHKHSLSRINKAFKKYYKDTVNKVNILISRENASTRRIADFNNLYDTLSQTFPDNEWIIFDNLPAKETVELFSSANLVVGVHGGALTNTIFCPSSCKVVELMPVKDDTHIKPNYCPNICYWHIISSLNLNYRLVPVNHNVSNPTITVDFNKIINTIKNF
jgi:hypothetical protein